MTSRKQAAVIFLHGLGDTPEGGPQQLRQHLMRLNPTMMRQIEFVTPAAPELEVTANEGLTMPAWFDVYKWPINIGDEEDRDGYMRSLAQVEKEIARLQRRGIPPSKIAITGFSQGGTIALLTAYGRSPSQQPFAACACMGSYLPLPDELNVTSQVAQNTPLFWGHGRLDNVVLFDKQQFGVHRLREQGVTVADREYMVGHAVDRREIEFLEKFLNDALFNNNENNFKPSAVATPAAVRSTAPAAVQTRAPAPVAAPEPAAAPAPAPRGGNVQVRNGACARNRPTTCPGSADDVYKSLTGRNNNNNRRSTSPPAAEPESSSPGQETAEAPPTPNPGRRTSAQTQRGRPRVIVRNNQANSSANTSPIPPTRGRATSPTRGRAASPTRGRATSPVRGRAASPTRGRAASPTRGRAASPTRAMSNVPASDPPQQQQQQQSQPAGNRPARARSATPNRNRVVVRGNTAAAPQQQTKSSTPTRLASGAICANVMPTGPPAGEGKTAEDVYNSLPCARGRRTAPRSSSPPQQQQAAAPAVEEVAQQPRRRATSPQRVVVRQQQQVQVRSRSPARTMSRDAPDDNNDLLPNQRYNPAGGRSDPPGENMRRRSPAPPRGRPQTMRDPSAYFHNSSSPENSGQAAAAAAAIASVPENSTPPSPQRGSQSPKRESAAIWC